MSVRSIYNNIVINSETATKIQFLNFTAKI